MNGTGMDATPCSGEHFRDRRRLRLGGRFLRGQVVRGNGRLMLAPMFLLAPAVGPSEVRANSSVVTTH